MDNALLIVALIIGSGGLTGLAVLYLQLRGERQERMRDRVIAAAIDLTASCTSGLACVRVWFSADRSTSAGREEASRALVEVQERWPGIVSEHARVDLLFGEASPVYDAADALVSAYKVVMNELEEASPDPVKAREHLDAAGEALDAFTRAAHRAIR
jgi:hypothetical protein